MHESALQRAGTGRAEEGGRLFVEAGLATVEVPGGVPVRYRVRRALARSRAVKVLYGEDELATVSRAAARAGSRPSGYVVATAALASAPGRRAAYCAQRVPGAAH